MNDPTTAVAIFCIVVGIGMVVFAGVLWFAVKSKK